jgi:hypothetical protein
LVGYDKVGRKYIMMGGMLLLFYYTDQSTNKCTNHIGENKTEMVEKLVLAELKEIKSKPWILSTRLTKGIQMEQL